MQEQDRPDVTRPNGPDAVTAEWMTAVLRANGLDVTVEQVNCSTIGVGVGMMSGLARLDIDYASWHRPCFVDLQVPRYQ